jgi:hypothetical protein
MLSGTSYYDGIKIEHTQEELDVMFQFLSNYKIFAFVDLGVHEGGLGYSILTEFPKMRYLGIEHGDDPCSALTLKVAHSKYAQLITGDCLSSDMITIVDNWMAERWPTFLYCDHPNNFPLIKTYKNLSRFGDYLGARSYLEERSLMKHEFQSVKFDPLLSTRLVIYTRKAK